MRYNKNIAMLGQKRIPSREGGVEIVVEELSTRMAQKGYNVTCYNRSGKHVSDKTCKQKFTKVYKGVRLKKVLTIDVKGLAAMTSSFFATWCSAFGKYSVVHFHAEGNCATILLPKIFRKKCIVTIHGLDYQRAKWGNFARKYILFGEKMAVKHADEIIVLSANVQEYFKEKYGRETKFIPNGVVRPISVSPDEIVKRFSIEKDDYILFLGRLVPEKGIAILINAFKQIKTNKKLVIAGGSSDTDEFVQEIKESASDDDRIIFTGFVQGKILEELYSNAYIYTLPSNLEGMPLSLLEAMSYGNCCLVSDIPECVEVVTDKAVIFEKGNQEDLVNKLQMLIDSIDIVAKYKKEAADYICNKYNWDDVVNQTLEIYYN